MFGSLIISNSKNYFLWITQMHSVATASAPLPPKKDNRINCTEILIEEPELVKELVIHWSF